jgi:transcriptional regulator GlxA family with amidase domain
VTRRVGIVLFGAFEELDAIGPFEVFGALSELDADWRAVTVAESGGVITGAHGLKVTADHSFEDCPSLEVILVPGGLGTREEMNNPQMLKFLQRAARTASYVTSVCTGALVLQRADFLAGRKATTHGGAIDLLRGMGDVEVVKERYVEDGNVVTSAGVSAGIDMSLYLVSLLTDAQTATNVQRMIEYYPQPPVFSEVAP